MNTKLLLLTGVILLVLTAGCLSAPKTTTDKASSFLTSSDQMLAGKDATEGGTVNDMDRKVISTANIAVEVKSVYEAFNNITGIAQEQGGFISGSSIYNTGGRYNGQVTLRVPQKNFYLAIGQIEALGTVKTKQISGKDVTEEFIDLSARLDNLEKQEIRLQEILKMASTVKDVLEVEHELERVRGEIERLTGRLNYLNQSVEMSTISASLAEPVPITGDDGWGITDALRESVGGFIGSVKWIIVFIGYALPIAVFLGFIIAIGLWIKRRVFKR